MDKTTIQRDGFSSAFGMLAATLGSAVGLGNIWRFPYEVGSSGGAGFLLIYLVAVLLVGVPLMIAEISLGRTAQTDSIGVYLKLAPRTWWWLVGAIAMVAGLLIVSFYSGVVGWVVAYVAKSLGPSLLTQDRVALESAFTSLIANPVAALGWQWTVLLAMGLILSFGVRKGIEAVTKKLMPILFLLLCVIALTSLNMPRAIEGVKFLFVPDMTKIDSSIVLKALSLAFFKLSLGVGTMTIYGSYFRQEQNIPRTVLTVMLADLAVSMLAGLAIFPAVFSLGFDPAGGPALLFNTIPAVFAQMPMGHVLMVLFFVLTTLAATGALLSLIEVPVAALNERLGWSRKTAIWVVVVTIIVLGAFCALSFSTLQHVALVGKRNIFDSFDFAGSKVLMPIAGMLTSLFVSLRWGKRAFVHANSNAGSLSNTRLLTVVFWTLALVSPVLIGVVMYVGLRT